MLFGLEKSIWVFYHFSKQRWKIRKFRIAFLISSFCSWFESSEFKYKYFSHAFASLQFLYFGKDLGHLYWLNSYYKYHGLHQTKFPRKASPSPPAAFRTRSENSKVPSLLWKLFPSFGNISELEEAWDQPKKRTELCSKWWEGTTVLNRKF